MMWMRDRSLHTALRRVAAFSTSAASAKPRVLVITGPTCVGKTRISLQIAEKYNGEIISADSMQVYKGMDIGTDKASLALRQKIPHHLIDVFSIQQTFSAGDFTHLANAAIDDIVSRGKLPIVVGGTAFYLQMLMRGSPGTPPHDDHIKARVELELQGKTWNEAFEVLKAEDPTYAAGLYRIAADHKIPFLLVIPPERNDWYRLKRALAIIRSSNRPVSSFNRIAQFENQSAQQSRYDFRPILLTMNRLDLFPAIDARCERLLYDGLVEETIQLCAEGLQSTMHASKALGYSQVLEYLQREWFSTNTISNAREVRAFNSLLAGFQSATRQFARKQMSFFRAQPEYYWVFRGEQHDDEIIPQIMRCLEHDKLISNAATSAQRDKEDVERSDMAKYVAEPIIFNEPAIIYTKVRKIRKLLAATFPESCAHLYDDAQRKRWRDWDDSSAQSSQPDAHVVSHASSRDRPLQTLEQPDSHNEPEEVSAPRSSPRVGRRRPASTRIASSQSKE